MKSKDIFKFLTLLIILSFISISCVTNEKTPKPDPTPTVAPPSPKPVDVTSDDEPLNDTVKQAYESHKDFCSGIESSDKILEHAGMTIYNETYKILEWLSKVRKLEIKNIPPICAYDEKEDTSKSTYEGVSYNQIMSSIGLYRNYPENVKLLSNSGNGSGIRGLYNYKHKYIFLNKKVGISSDNYGTLVHELLHTLQDQNFSLTKLFHMDDGENFTYDEDMAISALVEGDASLIKLLWIEKNNPGDADHAVPSDKLFLESFSNLVKNQLNTEDDPNDFNYPLEYSTSEVNFQYLRSIPFVRHTMSDDSDGNKVYEGGKINDFFTNLPISSEQILHPQKYIDREKAKLFPEDTITSLNTYFKSKNFNNVEDNYEYYTWKTLGEFGLTTLISLYDIDFQKSEENDSVLVTNNDVTPLDNALGWNGDRILIYSPTIKGKEYKIADSVFMLLSYWDTQNDARAYFERLSDIMTKKYDGFIEPISNDSGDIRQFKLNLGEDKTRFIHVEQIEDQLIMIERYSEDMFDDIHKILFPEPITDPVA